MLWHFLTKSKHHMTLKIKDKKIIWTKLYFRQFFNEKIWITWGLFVDKGSGSGWPKKTGSATLVGGIPCVRKGLFYWTSKRWQQKKSASWETKINGRRCTALVQLRKIQHWFPKLLWFQRSKRWFNFNTKFIKIYYLYRLLKYMV